MSNDSLDDELEERGTDLTRMANLSDGVFSIAMTLLVLDLRVPALLSSPDANASLRNELWALEPRLYTYALTFMVSGFYWMSHQRIFRHVQRYTRGLLWINIAYLFFVSLLPFSCALVGSHALLRAAWTVYTLNMAALGLSGISLLVYGRLRHLFNQSMTPALYRYLLARATASVVVFAVSWGVAWTGSRVAAFLPTLILVIPFGLRLWFKRRA